MMKKWLLRLFVLLIFLESIFTIWVIGRRLLPGSALSSLLKIYNLIYLALPLLLSAAILVTLILVLIRPNIEGRVLESLQQKRYFWGLLAFFTLILYECFQDLLYLQADLPAEFIPEIILYGSPILAWGALVALEAIIVLVLLRWPIIRRSASSRGLRDWMLPTALTAAFLILIILSGTGFITRSSKIMDVVGVFATPNAPLPMVQVIIVLVGVGFSYLLLKRLLAAFKLRIDNAWIEIFLFLLLTAVTYLVWSSVPLMENYFIDAPRAPNFQFNVTSDSIYYDVQAQQLLVGEGFIPEIQHPFYPYLLSGLHLLGGDHFQDIYLLQIAILSLTPFLLYKLAREVHNRFSGLLLAAFYISREHNALLLGDSITLSTVNLLMTESITMLGVVLVVYWLISWLESPQERSAMPLLIGSSIGLLVMIRIETLYLVPAFLLFALAALWKKWKDWVRSAALMASAVLVLTLPWMTRNWLVTGSFYLDKSGLVQRTIGSYTNDLLGENVPGPTAQEAPPSVEEVYQYSTVEKIFAHTKNSLSQALLYLPSNHQPLGGLDSFLKIVPEKRKVLLADYGYFSDPYLTRYVKILPYWWYDWDGRIRARSILPMLIVGQLAALGFTAAWRKNHLVSLVPIVVLLFHIGVFALFSKSGGRYIQVVDWVSLLYFSIGISWLSSRGVQYISGKGDKAVDDSIQAPQLLPRSGRSSRQMWKIGAAAAAVLIMLIGISMPVVERLSSPRYTRESLVRQLDQLNGVQAEEIRSLPGGGESDVLYGKALYPGFYQAGEIVLDDRRGRVPDAAVSRMMFYLVGMDNIWVSLPLTEAPDYFPHGSDVVLIGHYTRNSAVDVENKLKPYFLAEKVIFLNDGDGSFQELIAECDSEYCQDLVDRRP